MHARYQCQVRCHRHRQRHRRRAGPRGRWASGGRRPDQGRHGLDLRRGSRKPLRESRTGGGMFGRFGGQYHCRAGVAGRCRRLHRQSPRRSIGRGLPPRHNRPWRCLPNAADGIRAADGDVPDPGDTRRPADHANLSRRLRRTGSRRYGRGLDRRRPDHLPGRLSLGSAGSQESLHQGFGSGP